MSARFIQIDVDTSNGISNHGDPFGFVGLSEVQFNGLAPAGTTEVTLGPTTHYFRRSFMFSDSPERTTLEFDMLLDDAAVVYVNGVEIHRHNLPAGPISNATLALFEQKNALRTDTIRIPGDVLVAGENVIAVEVHQAAADDTDMLFAMDMSATTLPPEPFLPDSIAVQINEVSAAGTESFFIELINRSDALTDISGYQVSVSGQTRVLPEATLLAPGEFAVVSDLNAEIGNRVVVHNRDRSMVSDSVEVGSRTIGLTAMGDSAYPSAATPGLANEFSIEHDVVINEIMYNFRPTVGRPAVPAVLELNTLVELGANWRYNDTGDDLPPDWHLTRHDVGGNWSQGPGLLGFESAAMPAPGIQTVTADSRDNGTLTFYFESEFDLTAEQLATFDGYQLRHVVDDAALIFINDQEAVRFNLPSGDVTSETRSLSSVRNAELSEPVALPRDLFRVGTNRIAVEVHQQSPTSNDIVFGLELQGGPAIEDAIASTPYRDNDEEWIELYNRGDSTVDLSGWSLGDAVEFDFAPGQTIAPGQYLVVAKDSDALLQKYPEIATQVIGQFAGSLGNKNDRIILFDANHNRADVVEYYEDGNWPVAADGRGSSLELQDPHADNSRGGAWEASDESSNEAWQQYSYQGITKASVVGADNQWREFIIGMLADGTVLLDDIEIIKDPNGEAVNVLQNGTFENDTIGAHPEKWRLIGNHRDSEVVADPDDPNNKVLKFVANGATGHMHNHGETTLMENGETHRINNGVEYSIRFKARWVTGSNQLNTRLYFNRLAKTTPINRHDQHGTPGRVNSAAVSNLGPTYERLLHSPAVPSEDTPVTVSVTANDADSVNDVKLWYRVADREWTSVSMSRDADRFAATIPNQESSTIVQFYVEGTDGNGNTTHFPRAGRDSRALYKVDDGLASDTGLHNLRMVLTPEDAELLHERTAVMSNDPVGLTLIYDESTIFYDARVRLSGSQRARPIQPRLSFKVSFNADQLFRGVHNGLTLDRSESTGFGQREHLYHQGMTRAGGLPSEYNDLFNIITPQRAHTGGAEAQMARYSDIFLDEQYQNGSSGQVYEYELVYYPTTTVDRDPESRKLPNPDSVVGSPIRHLGDSNEDYRWTFLNKNNRAEDDYSRLMEFAKVFSEGRTASERITEVIDLDQWLRAYAFSVITGHGDNFGGDGAQHNLQLYVRPSDNRVLFFPHDLDAFFQPTRAILPSADLRKLIGTPEREHMYYGHMADMLTHVFNREYMEHWTDLYQTLLPRQRFDRHLNDLVRRTEFLFDRIERVAERTDFTANPEAENVDSSIAIVNGKAWFDVREIRIAGSSQPLPIEWTDVVDWQVELPVSLGANQFTLEAYDFQGRQIASQDVSITSSVGNQIADAIAITEINYNPHAPTAAEIATNPNVDNDAFEFVEVTNRSAAPVNLLGMQFTLGIEFSFPTTVLQPGESTLVVNDLEAFAQRYGENISVAGEFTSGRLANGGERLTIGDLFGSDVVSVEYSDSDPWFRSTDGVGATLQRTQSESASNRFHAWSASQIVGGSPGVDQYAIANGILINEVLANSGDNAVDAIELFNSSSESINVGGWFLSDDQDALFKYQIAEGTIVEAGEYLVVTETQFNPNPNAQQENHFALSSEGDQIWLVTRNDDGELDRIIDHVRFGGSDVGQTLGRSHQDRFLPLETATLGGANANPASSGIVISEFSFNPGAPTEQALLVNADMTSNDLEFVELHNPTNTSQDLAGWQLTSAIDFEFEGITLQASETIVMVSFQPQDAAKTEAFRTHYSINKDVTLIGSYDGQLDNDWELIRMLRPSTDATVASGVLAEEVLYDDELLPGADGTGLSLARSTFTTLPSLSPIWIASIATPGRVQLSGDVNQDGVTDVLDVNTVCSGLRLPASFHDLNGDGLYNYDDVSYLIHDVLGTHLGDANVDGIFNSADFVQVFQAAEYEDATPGNSLWSEGDWNCDGDFTTTDFVEAFRDAGYIAASRQVRGVASAVADRAPNPLPSAAGHNPVDAEPTAQVEKPVRWWDDTHFRDLIFGDFDPRDLDHGSKDQTGSIDELSEWMDQ